MEGNSREDAMFRVDKGTGNPAYADLGAYEHDGDVMDWYHDAYVIEDGNVSAPDDGSAWLDPAGTERVWRGGAFICQDPYRMRTYTRSANPPSDYWSHVGFRWVR